MSVQTPVSELPSEHPHQGTVPMGALPAAKGVRAPVRGPAGSRTGGTLCSRSSPEAGLAAAKAAPWGPKEGSPEADKGTGVRGLGHAVPIWP